MLAPAAAPVVGDRAAILGLSRVVVPVISVAGFLGPYSCTVMPIEPTAAKATAATTAALLIFLNLQISLKCASRANSGNGRRAGVHNSKFRDVNGRPAQTSGLAVDEGMDPAEGRRTMLLPPFRGKVAGEA